MYSLSLVPEVQRGEDAYDDLSLQVNFRKRALQLVALLQKITSN